MMSNVQRKRFKNIKAEKDFTYMNIASLLKELTGALKKGSPVRLSLSDIEIIDLTAIQLLISAKRSFLKAGVPLELNFNSNDEISLLISNCGFKSLAETKTV